MLSRTLRGTWKFTYGSLILLLCIGGIESNARVYVASPEWLQPTLGKKEEAKAFDKALQRANENMQHSFYNEAKLQAYNKELNTIDYELPGPQDEGDDIIPEEVIMLDTPLAGTQLASGILVR